jgi:phosphoribosylamine--glycine ligase
MVFHAGTQLEGDELLTSGGRVLCVTALGDSIRLAQANAYQAVHRIQFEGMQYRKDIGHRAAAKA